ncbi:hypothetical protein [Bacteroidetes bacterium endosymbiont of Geopemphigus sp.]|uniref:hypothetical protein n=1 Tax=Bacteroidetes bacterium endosymbiont of Geopemphigus sp. TaxID=2047937 RepID=UPI000CD17D2A|nr:hypothetical protein [Bacteroidetes bacterium endosymbiont of Geopemphigus sp.]
MDIIQSLEWCYDVTKFFHWKKIFQIELEGIINAINLSTASYGMQPCKIVVISDSKLREKAFDQTQITESSHLILSREGKLGDPIKLYHLRYIINLLQVTKKRRLPYGKIFKEAFDRILNLSTQNIRCAVLAALNYSALDDPFQKIQKVRKLLSEIVVHM